MYGGTLIELNCLFKPANGIKQKFRERFGRLFPQLCDDLLPDVWKICALPENVESHICSGAEVCDHACRQIGPNMGTVFLALAGGEKFINDLVCIFFGRIQS